MLFVEGTETELKAGPSAEVSLELRDEGYGKLEIGFTRGDLSSQAYAELFNNKDFQPDPATAVFDTAPYEEQYKWLGSHARKLVFEVIDETLADSALELDVFAYDFDEPDVIRKLAKLGPRLRLFLDDSDINDDGGGQRVRKAESLEVVNGVAGTSVKRGSFGNLAHDKILIQKRKGKPTKVLSGSANFSVRGLYVQANNVFVFDDPATALISEEAFEQAWKHPGNEFPTSPIASGWFPRAFGQRPRSPRPPGQLRPPCGPRSLAATGGRLDHRRRKLRPLCGHGDRKKQWPGYGCDQKTA